MNHFKIGLRLLMIAVIAEVKAISHCDTTTDAMPNERPLKCQERQNIEFVDNSENNSILKTHKYNWICYFNQVEKLDTLDQPGKTMHPNPNPTRYFFGPTAMPQGRRKGYYQNILLTGNFINYGINDHISIGGGVELISSLSGYRTWFITPKIGFEVAPKVNLGAGIYAFGFADQGSATLGYAVLTFGTRETNITCGLGNGFIRGEWASHPVFSIAGTHRIGNKVALQSENYFFPGFTGTTRRLGIHGIKLIKKKASIELGVMEAGVPFPFLGFTVVF